MNRRLAQPEVEALFEQGKVVDPWTHEVLDLLCQNCGHDKFDFRGFNEDSLCVYDCRKCKWQTTFISNKAYGPPPRTDGNYRRSS